MKKPTVLGYANGVGYGLRGNSVIIFLSKFKDFTNHLNFSNNYFIKKNHVHRHKITNGLKGWLRGAF